MRFIDEEEIEAKRTVNGGWNRTQLAQWGVPWPPPPGWKRVILEYGIPYNETRNMKKKTQRSSERAVLCRNCCTPMSEGGSEKWFCERCGLTWRSETASSDQF